MNYGKSTSKLAMIFAVVVSVGTLGGVYHYNRTMAAAMTSTNAETTTIVEEKTDVPTETEVTTVTTTATTTDVVEETQLSVECMDVIEKPDIEDSMAFIDMMQRRKQIVKAVDTAEAQVATIFSIVESLPETNRQINTSPVDITDVSGMSADQFNTLIDKIIADRGLTNRNKLYNTGAAFEFIESEYKINGVYVLAIFTYESAFAERCINTNNFAGLKGRRGWKSFETPSDCISYEGWLLRNHYVDKGLISLSSIGKKYCETSAWGTEVGSIVDKYLGYMTEEIN